MSFGPIKRLVQRARRAELGSKLVLGFCLLFVVSTLTLFAVVYSLFSQSLSQRDRDFITAKGKQYSAIYLKDGVQGLERGLFTDHVADFVTRVSDPRGKTLFYHAPLNLEHFDIRDVEQAMTGYRGRGWNEFAGKADGDRLEILNVLLPDSALLQVGMSTDTRDDLLERIEHIFFSAFFITVMLGVVGGLLFSRRALKPLRNLIATLHSIEAGELQSRVPDPKTGDEMEEVISLFNQMLNRIQLLIRGMADTLDNVSHDLKTPITRFRSIAERALTHSDSAEECREALESCVEQADEMVAMMDSLMDISEAQAGTMKLNLEEFPAANLLNEVCELYDIVAEEKGISITTEASVGTRLRGDRRRLKQVLANLVDNAVKYSFTDGRVEISAKDRPDGIEISVWDSGAGIAADDLPRIWDRLYRGDHSRSTPGLGLGLSLVQSIVRAHGGAVKVDSELGYGSRFTVRLPH